jgi:polygalacturonase
MHRLIVVALSSLASVCCESAFIVSVTAFGGRGDGTFDNAAAFTAAVSAVSAAGGGTVYVPSGRFLSSPFNLTSRLTLLLGNGAVLVGGHNITAWPLLSALPAFPGGQRYAPIIGCYNCSSVAIATNGTTEVEFDGGGAPWWLAKLAHTLHGDRPHMLEFFGCDGVDVSGIHLHSSPYWTVRISWHRLGSRPAVLPAESRACVNSCTPFLAGTSL